MQAAVSDKNHMATLRALACKKPAIRGNILQYSDFGRFHELSACFPHSRGEKPEFSPWVGVGFDPVLWCMWMSPSMFRRPAITGSVAPWGCGAGLGI